MAQRRIFKNKESIFGGSYKTPTYGPKTTTSSSKKLDIEELSKQYGIEPPKQKKTGVLERIGGFLSAGETGEIGYQITSGKSLTEALKSGGRYAAKGLTGQGYGEKHTYSDVLRNLGVTGEDFASKAIRGIGGTALDIALDPTTYLTVGTSALAKIGGKEISKEGVEQLAKLTAKGLSREAAEKVVLNTPEFIAKKGIRLGGKYIASADNVVGGALRAYTEPLSLAGDVIKFGGEKYKPLGKVLTSIEDMVGEAFGSKTFKADKVLKENNLESLIPKLQEISSNKNGTKIASEAVADGLKDIQRKLGRVPTETDLTQFIKNAAEGFGESLDKQVVNAVDLGNFTKSPDLHSAIKKSFSGDEAMTSWFEDYLTTSRKRWVDTMVSDFGWDKEEALKITNYIYQGKISPDDLASTLGYSGKTPDVLKARTGKEFVADAKGAIGRILKPDVDFRIAKNRKQNIGGMLNDLVDGGLAKPIQTAESQRKQIDLFSQAGQIKTKKATEAQKALKKSLLSEARELKYGIKADPASGIVKVFNDGFVESYEVPKEIAEVINGIYNPKQTPEILKAYDWVNKKWKNAVYTMWPASRVKDYMQANYSNILAGNVNPKNVVDATKVIKGQDNAIQLLGKETMKASDLKRIFTEKNLIDSGFVASELADGVDIQKMADLLNETDPSKVKRFISRLNPVAKDGYLNTMATFGDNQQKVSLVLDRLRKGFSMDEAILDAKKFLLDYSPESFTDFERNVMKRIIPFYSYMRRNLPLQMAILGKGEKGRGAYTAMFKGLRNVSEITGGKLSDEDKQYLPEWLTRTLNLPIGNDKDGNPKYLTQMGLGIEQLADFNPFDITDSLQTLFSGVTPIIKTPVEMASGYSFFTKTPIEESTFYTRGYEGISTLPGVKQVLQAKEIEKPRYEKIDGKWTKTGETYKQIVINPKRKLLLDAFLGRLYTSAGKAYDPRKSLADKITNLSTGMRVSSVNVPYYKESAAKAYEEQLTQQLIDMGYLKEYKSVYKPKD